MKKKIVSYLILACSLIGMVTIGSCRDYDDYADLRALNKIDHQKFDDTLKIHRHDIDSIFEILKNRCMVNCDSLDSVVHVLDSATTKWLLKGLTGDSIKNILGLDSTFQDSNDVAGVLRYLNQRVNAIRHDLDSIADTLTQTDKILMRFDSIIDSRVDTLDSIVNNVLMPYKDTIDSITPILRNLKKCVDDTIKPKLDSLEKRIEKVEQRVDSLFDAEKKRITSLYVQGTVNPTFGSFALPIGIRSNILSCYYGKALTDVAFPAYGASLDAVLDPGMELQAAELAAIGANPTQTTLSANNTILSDSANNAGRIFITVNPNEVKIDSTYKFYLVNSLGDSTWAKMDTLKPSKEKLTFGLMTRAAGDSKTGFYEAAVKIEESGLDTLSPKLAVSKEQLKNIAKDVLSYKDGINLSGIAGAVFKLAQTQLDANAVKVEWKDSLGEHSVTSQYDIAVAAIQPLSYQAGQGIGTSRRLPTISPLTELSISKPSFTPINLNDITFTIDGTPAHISFGTVTITTGATVKVTVDKPVSVSGSTVVTVPTDYEVQNLNQVLTDIQTEFNGKILAWQNNVNGAIDNIMTEIMNQVDDLVKNQMAGKLNTEIDKMLESVKNSINNSISGYNTYFSKMNSLISRINSVTSRINSKLDLDVNAFLQPTLLYQGNDGTFHPMSNDPAYPSKFTAANGGIVLYPTSYTAELLAPAYKKYIAVVGGPAAGVAEANGLEYMNEVIDGNRFAVPFKVTTPGTYTIYYSAVDYSGVISAQRFYVTVE